LIKNQINLNFDIEIKDYAEKKIEAIVKLTKAATNFIIEEEGTKKAEYALLESPYDINKAPMGFFLVKTMGPNENKVIEIHKKTTMPGWISTSYNDELYGYFSISQINNFNYSISKDIVSKIETSCVKNIIDDQSYKNKDKNQLMTMRNVMDELVKNGFKAGKARFPLKKINETNTENK
jgi:hypothetical protein